MSWPRSTAAASRRRRERSGTASPARWSRRIRACAWSSSAAATSAGTRVRRSARRRASRRHASARSSRSADPRVVRAPARLFGTDGVRGVAGEFLTAELALSLGRAATSIAPASAPQVLIVRDTRESGEMLEAALAAGIAAAGGHALLGGVLPTPGAALLVRRFELHLAAVVSASHNPYRDNGIKFFGADGTKLGEVQEREIERLVAAAEAEAEAANGRVRGLHGAGGDYLRELHSRFAGLDLSGRSYLLDCANGATYRAAPEIFRRLGAQVEAIAAEPD